ncbi:unnamed protein product [Malassezia sympodialis ATCC 42132]|uniref:uncharacterized protein n=1 Tax=Malassezia sympodialis (strain ATCC 42132) TaxID=1230383 RepID=UPI0002C1B7AA|nr:uncharacterized protein MSY001_1754 [Malassezia sympodialis ATCC 42132]CCU99048.1 unnamed protein product [Malassezia sympodialis ATCC 42132]|eukprot:XP_018740316.1 uncharacterized protein MSY001_1754 [Malassezia sympodialis ATCC 42132]
MECLKSRHIRKVTAVPEVCGIPIVNEDLQYGSLPLYVVGTYSAIQIGPTAYNLGGIREGADRVAAKLNQLAGGSSDELEPSADAVTLLVVILGVSKGWAQEPATPSSESSDAAATSANPLATASSQASPETNNETTSSPDTLMPKVMVVTLFEPERKAWIGRNFTYPRFNLTQTYFIVNGIAGINPAMGTIGSVGFPKFAVQFGLQYGLDAREIPSNWTDSFWNYGTSQPGEYPGWLYGTEVFGLNTGLLDKVFPIATQVQLNDTQLAMDQRAAYSQPPARSPPAVFHGDVMTSDLYFTGAKFGDMASNLTYTLTNGTGAYALTAQEDNAVLETLVRAHKAGVADYGRTILYRSASDFDRDYFQLDGLAASSQFYNP